MKYKQITAVLVSACLLLAGCAGFEKKQNPSYTDTLFDTVIKVQILGSADEDVLKGLEKLCKDYDKNFSMTNEEGELYKINHAQGAPVEVSDDMVTLIQKEFTTANFQEEHLILPLVLSQACGILRKRRWFLPVTPFRKRSPTSTIKIFTSRTIPYN